MRGGRARGVDLEGRLPFGSFHMAFPQAAHGTPSTAPPLCQPLADRHPNSQGLGLAAAQTEEGGQTGRMKTKVLSDDGDLGPPRAFYHVMSSNRPRTMRRRFAKWGPWTHPGHEQGGSRAANGLAKAQRTDLPLPGERHGRGPALGSAARGTHQCRFGVRNRGRGPSLARRP